MKKGFIILLLLGGGIYLQLRWHEHFSAAEKAKTAAPQPATAAAKPAPPPSVAKPVPPLEALRLPWPPSPAQLQAVVPNYAALEGEVRSAAAGLGIQFTEQQLREVMGNGWNAMVGRGGTPQDKFKYEMNMFDVSGVNREYDGKISEERTNTFQYVLNGQRVYNEKRPVTADGITECWEKIQIGRGTENHGTYITIGGTKALWIKLTWDASFKSWIRRTPEERRQFIDGYERKLFAEIIPAAQVNAAKSPNLQGIRDLNSLIIAYRPAFEYRYLTVFAKEFRSIPWGAD